MPFLSALLSGDLKVQGSSSISILTTSLIEGRTEGSLVVQRIAMIKHFQKLFPIIGIVERYHWSEINKKKNDKTQFQH